MTTQITNILSSLGLAGQANPAPAADTDNKTIQNHRRILKDLADKADSKRNDKVIAPFDNPRAEGYHEYYPKQDLAPGTLLSSDKFPQNANPPKLFEPITVKGVTFPHRLWVAPMCMYSSDDGAATDFHFIHTGSMAMRGWSTVMIEATAVVPEGRITPQDAGIWSDKHIAPLKRQVDMIHANNGIVGIQLAHAGRKASTLAPFVQKRANDGGWKGGDVAPEKLGGWPNEVAAPSALSYNNETYPQPLEVSKEYIESLKQAYREAIERCKIIGFDFIELHGAHGYMFHEFTDPVSNTRTDEYGGSLENRIRLPLEVAKIARESWKGPLFYRVSASDWLESLGPENSGNGEKDPYKWWGLEQTTIFTQKLADAGVDLIDVSSGGNDPRQKIDVRPSYQVQFARHLKENVKNILVGTVGLITESKQANDLLEDGAADVVLMAREVLRDIDFPLRAARELGAAVYPLAQYELAWSRMVVKRDHTAASAHHHGRSQVEGEEGTDKHRKEMGHLHPEDKADASKTA